MITGLVVGLITGYLLSMPPMGPTNILVISQGLRHEIRNGVAVGAGAGFMDMIYIIISYGGYALIKGFIPSIPNKDALYIAIGIIGATVMPHNLYLHSSLVQTRKINRTSKGIREAIKFNLIDTNIALNIALFVNAAILVLAASAFFTTGHNEVSDIQDAHRLLSDILGTRIAPIIFAVALIAAGQSSTLTGTLSGQIVMEGYLNLRIQPWLRRLITRLIAIVPTLIVIFIFGEDSTTQLLILSQVILSLQLGFAVIPLIHLTSDKKRMGEFVNSKWIKIVAWLTASLIVYLNGKLVIESVAGWVANADNKMIYYILAGIVIFFFGVLCEPFFNKSLVKAEDAEKKFEIFLNNAKAFEGEITGLRQKLMDEFNSMKHGK